MRITREQVERKGTLIDSVVLIQDDYSDAMSVSLLFDENSCLEDVVLQLASYNNGDSVVGFYLNVDEQTEKYFEELFNVLEANQFLEGNTLNSTGKEKVWLDFNNLCAKATNYGDMSWATILLEDETVKNAFIEFASNISELENYETESKKAKQFRKERIRNIQKNR